MTQEEIFAIIDRHFAFETPELIHRVGDPFSESIIWEAPAWNLVLTDRHKIIEEYLKS